MSTFVNHLTPVVYTASHKQIITTCVQVGGPLTNYFNK